MRPGAETLGVALGLLLGAALAQAQVPEVVEEDVAAAVAELEALGQPPSAAEVAGLLAEPVLRPAVRRWSGESRLRWQRTAAGLDGREALVRAGGPVWDLRLRARQSTSGQELGAGTAAARWGPLALRAGGWTWREGYGLLMGGAGRSGSVAADTGLGSGGGGPRGWTGWPEPRAAVGGVVQGRAGGWQAGGAWGQEQDTRQAIAVATLGRHSGSWRLVAASRSGAPPSVGANGRWRRGPWSGDWEAAVHPEALPALAGGLRWSGGRRWGVEVMALVVPRGASGPLASGVPLVGSGAGSGGALRVGWRPATGVGFAALLAAAARDGQTAAAPQRRRTSDLLGHATLPADLVLSARLRTNAGEETTWADQWPWAPPSTGPARRTQVLSLALEGREAGSAWRLVARSLAVDHSPTTGRRTLVGVEVRTAVVRRVDWRLAWRLTWGDPVDLADAVSPLPGLVVPRHWGASRGGWFGRLGWAPGPWRLDAAVDLRTASGGDRAAEFWLGAAGRW